MHQAVDGALRWRFNVNQPVMGADFKVFLRIFVNEGAAEHTETADTRWERYRTRNFSTGTFDRIDDLRCRRIQAAVVERPEFNPNAG